MFFCFCVFFKSQSYQLCRERVSLKVSVQKSQVDTDCFGPVVCLCLIHVECFCVSLKNLLKHPALPNWLCCPRTPQGTQFGNQEACTLKK